ncbi:MAG: hypothetical protein Q7U02_15155 [Desulfosalsimonadaceae bacterium]|nr:hypothetical protein [Desulfosalsimonadaceae bacterium]
MKVSVSAHGDDVYWEAPLPVPKMEIADFPALSAALIFSLEFILLGLFQRSQNSAAVNKKAPTIFEKIICTIHTVKRHHIWS